MADYAPFGNAVFGQTLFGVPPTISPATTFTIIPIGYDTLQVDWVPVSGAVQQILVRSAYGIPTSITDGTVLLNESQQATPQVTAFSAQFIDTGLRSGHFYYYALFVLVAEQATPQIVQFVRAGGAQGLVITNWGFGNTYRSWTPDFYLEDDDNIFTAAYPQGPGPLTRYLELLGYEMDWMRSEVESFVLFSNADLVSGALLPALGANYGMPYEPELGMIRSRVLVKNAVFLYKWRGTVQGIEAAASAFSGFGCKVTIGKNLEIQLDDSAFDRSTGHWNGVTALVGLQDVFTTVHTVTNPPNVNSNVLLMTTFPVSTPFLISTDSAGNSFEEDPAGGSPSTTGIPIPQQATLPIYTLSAYFQPTFSPPSIPTPVVRSVFAQIDWYDINGGLISSTTGSSVLEIVDQWVRVYVTGSPPAGAIWFGRTLGITAGSSPGTELHLIDAEQVEIGTSPTTWDPPRDIKINLYPTRQNLIPNPVGLAGSFGWTITGGTIAAAAAGISWPAQTSSGLKLTANSTSPIVLTSTPIAVNPNISYTFSGYLKAATTARSTRVAVEYFTALGALITTNQTNFADVVSGFTQGAVINAASPSNAATAKVVVTILAPVNTEVHDLGAVLFEPASALLPYFDANFSPFTDYSWEGTPNESISDYYPSLALHLARLTEAMVDYVPIGSTFTLVTGKQAFLNASEAG